MRYLGPALLAWVIAQALKVAWTSARERRLNLRVLAETGGMPSSHAAIVMGLTSAIGRLNGVTSAPFAIALIFSVVVLSGAAGGRRSPGRGAEPAYRRPLLAAPVPGRPPSRAPRTHALRGAGGCGPR